MDYEQEVRRARAAGKPPMFLGETYDRDGNPLPVQGVSVHGTVTDTDAVAAIRAARDLIASSPAGQCWAWLPPESWHVTWLRLLDRRSEHDAANRADWQGDLRGRAADLAMVERLRGLDPGARPPFRLKADGFWRFADAAGFWVAGATEDEAARIQAMRDRIEAAAGLSHRPKGIEYRLHITLGYQIAWPDETEAAAAARAIEEAEALLAAMYPVFEFGPPEVTMFEDLSAFPVTYHLGQG